MIVKLCEASRLPENGELKAFRRGDMLICVANASGLFAFENRCPHQGAPLSAGRLDGTSIVCPYHAWRFDVVTGRPEMAGDPCLTQFEIRRYGDEVWIQLPDAQASVEGSP